MATEKMQKCRACYHNVRSDLVGLVGYTLRKQLLRGKNWLSTWPMEEKHVLIFSWKSIWPCLTSGSYPRMSCLLLQVIEIIITFHETDVKPEHDFPSGRGNEYGFHAFPCYFFRDLELNFSVFYGANMCTFFIGSWCYKISNQLPYDKNPFALKLNVPPLPPQIKNLWVVFFWGVHLIFGGEVGP